MVDSDETPRTAVRQAHHRARARFFVLVLIAMVALGVVSLSYSLNWISGLIILGLVVLVAGIGWIAGSLAGRSDDR